MGFAPVPTQKCAACVRRRVLTIRLESKEHNEPGARPGKGRALELLFYLNFEERQDPHVKLVLRARGGILHEHGPELAFDRIRRKASRAPQLDSRLRKNESKQLTANGRQLLAA